MNNVKHYVMEYFLRHPLEEVRPGPITRYVAEKRENPQQSPGAVRAAIASLVDEGLLVKAPGSPLRYHVAREHQRVLLEMNAEVPPAPPDPGPSPEKRLFTIVLVDGSGVVRARHEVEVLRDSLTRHTDGAYPVRNSREILRTALKYLEENYI